MLEKLIESWLDSASERSYQAVFCQMLANKGYTVVHSSRHSPIEQGKDIIALDSNGTACAFQLKGNPGTRLTLSQFTDIQGQIQQLLNQSIEHPSIPNAKSHRSILVTNGYIEEEAQQAIRQINKKNRDDGYPNRKLETLTRDQLLKWAKELEYSLWPAELGDIRALLEIFMLHGGELFPLDKFHRLLSALMKLDDGGKTLNPTEFSRRTSSAALLVAVALTPFSKKHNHWAVISAWTAFSTYLIAAATKHDIGGGKIKFLLALAEDEIFDSLYNLINEAIQKDGWLVAGDPATDYIAYKWRYTLLMSLGSLLYFWIDRKKIRVKKGFKGELQNFLSPQSVNFDVWGEGAFPQLMTYAWYLFKQNDKNALNAHLRLIAAGIWDKKLLDIYQPFEEAARNRLSEHLEDFKPSSPLSFSTSVSWVAKAFFENCVAMDEKAFCKDLWQKYSRTVSVEFHPSTSEAYCLWHTEKGNNLQTTIEPRAIWQTIKAEIESRKQPNLSSLLLQRPILCWLWCIVAPHRTTSQVATFIFSSLTSDSPKRTKKISPKNPKRKSTKKSNPKKKKPPNQRRRSKLKTLSS